MPDQVTTSVRDFYNKMPFNIREDVASHVESNMNLHYVLEMFPTLKELDLSNCSIIEIGCGVGWFSNFIAYHFRPKTIVALDLSEISIARAKEVSEHLNTYVEFVVGDLFEYCPPQKFDIAISNGVLHHTKDCPGALRRICADFLKDRGHICVGLYHLYGRKPFLDHFAAMQKSGTSEDEQFAEYRRLHSNITDGTHARSWFRDQVLHPHETQHTAHEVAEIFAASGVHLVTTSVNEFGPVGKLDNLDATEREFEALGQQRLEGGAYFPGFFTCIGRKQGRLGKLFDAFSRSR